MKVPSLKKHSGSEMCKKMQKRREKRAQQAAQKQAETQEFYVEGKKLERVKEFLYLGRLLRSDEDDSWVAIASNLRKARQRWGQVARILTREGATPQVMGYFYKAIVQAALRGRNLGGDGQNMEGAQYFPP